MPDPRPLDLALVWHMHQPDYRDQASGDFTQPWVYLHAMKDYTDMAAHLEQHPGMRAVVNLVPVLVDQLEDYCDQFATGRLRDPLLRLLARDETSPLTAGERDLVIAQCFHANNEKMVAPYPPYEGLHALFAVAGKQGEGAYGYLADRFFYDLVTWYHLVWTGETVRRASELVTRLMTVGMGYTRADRLALFDLIGDHVRGVVGRYARLAVDGRIELSSTPHHHPLAPLLIDFGVAREAVPAAPLPQWHGYPGGTGRVQFHIQSALDSHARRFGARPAGIWPAEGGISGALLKLLAQAGCRWTASGEGVLANSLRGAGGDSAAREQVLYRPYRIDGEEMTVFFRDDRLSDRIGFDYTKWHSRDAALNFVDELERIAAQAGESGTPLVSVILDGENCWEYYPYNGYYFLDMLYGALETHPDIRTTTYAAYLDRQPEPGRPRARPGRLGRLAAGSWVNGDFATWIGSREKNHAWDLLSAAKQSFDLVMASGRLDDAARAAALRQLAVCESSDWFWWMGDYNPSHAVASFDRLFRANLARLYELLHLPAPLVLREPISGGGGHPESGGTMRRSA
jgi:alpha-amylase/alpha-mannosidase (GH57 family)